jgi:hypothetical protein
MKMNLRYARAMIPFFLTTNKETMINIIASDGNSEIDGKAIADEIWNSKASTKNF